MTAAPRTAPPFVLASASPRRLELLTQIGMPPDIVDAAEIDETPRRDELPRLHAARLAREKAAFVAERHPGALVLGADTVVACGRRTLPKAEDEPTARRCLDMLSGRRHRVMGGVALVLPEGRVLERLVVTIVTFKRLDRREIEDYIATGEWQGKAGGYAIQGCAAVLVRFLEGSYSNVVGLPLFETNALLVGAGYRPQTV